MHFFFGPLVMSYPMMGAGLAFTDAFFEAVSAVTTTGASVLATVEDKPATFLFARAWMQWYGGLGIVVLALAVLIEPGQAARRLGDLDDYEDDLVGTTRSHVGHVLVVYGLITLLGIVVLKFVGTGWRDAVLYIFSAVSTGGFAPYDNSLAALNGWVPQAMVLLFSVAGGISFVFYRQAFRKHRPPLFQDQQTVAFLAACFIAMILSTLCLWVEKGTPLPLALLRGGFNALSAQTTAGFSSMDVSQTGPCGKLVLVFSVLSGGCLGSTAGGVKILRILIVFRLFNLLIMKTAASGHAVSHIRLGKKQLATDELLHALSIVLMYIIVTAVSVIPFILMGHHRWMYFWKLPQPSVMPVLAQGSQPRISIGC